ncbi:hypothetical protein DFH07DRAFT_785424 [Mycena maculata]|uniref:Uncharacterized protein n=1 Tax=Mycena maculata TaxID=230809 RepID=A0AAD7HB96_9AGAR|nr:hypothetical protein DFH07DRAFT_785424 [Mycena maculata]
MTSFKFLQSVRLRLSQIEDADNVTRVENSRLEQERQRQLLEEKKSISLDLIVYPILSIPAEVTWEIFLHCLSDKHTEPSASVGPMLLAAIVRSGEWLLRAKDMLSSLHVVLPNPSYRYYDSFFRNGSGESPCSDFTITALKQDYDTHCLEAIFDSFYPSFKPHLESLTVHIDREYTVFTLLDALKKAAHIHTIAFYVLNLRYIFPALYNLIRKEVGGHDATKEQLSRKFQELKKNGMRIHIGREKDSWI